MTIGAQSPKKPLTKEILADIVSKKGGMSPFVMLTPNDFEGFSGFVGGDPCSTALIIDFGQTVNGSLAASDCRLDDNSYADFYVFNGNQGQQITINLSSAAFDTYLGLANETGTFVIEDNDGGGGSNSRITATLPATGVYIILANSFLPNAFGQYSLSLAVAPVCTYSLEPTSSSVPGAGGTFTFAVNTQPGCYWTTYYDIYSVVLSSVTSAGIGPGTVSYRVSPNSSGSNRSDIIRVSGQVFTVNQTFLVCTYSISPTSADHSPDAGTYQFMMNTAEGCPWIAYYGQNDYWLWTSNELRRGPGPVVYTVAANNGVDRTGTIVVAGNTFTARQIGRNCTYSVSPTNIRVSPAGQYGTISVETQPGCTWSFWVGYSWVVFPFGSVGAGSATVAYQAYANSSFTPRTWTVLFTGATTFNVVFSQSGIPYRTRFDFFGDSKADLGVFRPSTNEWVLLDSQYDGVYSYRFGVQGDILVPGDFNGDRYTEIAVFRPSSGAWYMFDRATNTYSTIQFGTDEDIPAPADYDGDGMTDIAVFRPSTGVWYIARTSDGGVTIARFGLSTDAPVPADYDGDGKTDIAIWRRSVGEWWYWASSSGQVFAAQFGTSTDKAAPGDYTGDGKADIAIWRPSNGFWYVLRSEDYSYFAFPFGLDGDIPVPGDYDADGMFDASVFRPSNATWYSNRSASNVLTRQFGLAGDQPVSGAYVR